MDFVRIVLDIIGFLTLLVLVTRELRKLIVEVEKIIYTIDKIIYKIKNKKRIQKGKRKRRRKELKTKYS